MNRKQVLEDTIKYYSEDTNRRCVKNSGCYYNPINAGKEGISEGCAIGRLISEELQIELDSISDSEENGSGVYNLEVFILLPEEIQALGQDFLSSLQNLHDSGTFWSRKGLTEAGKRRVTEIKRIYGIQ